MTGFLRRHTPSLVRFFERETRPPHAAIFVALTSLTATAILLAAPARGTAAAWTLWALTAAQVALFTWAFAGAVRFASSHRLDGAAYSLAATLLVAYLLLDRIVLGVTGAHASPTVAREAYEAVRAGALTPGTHRIAGALAGMAVLWLVLTVLLKLLARLPVAPRADTLFRSASVPWLLAVGTAASLGACFIHDAPSAQAVAGAVPWDPECGTGRVTPRRDGVDRTAALLGNERVFDLLKARSATLLAGPIRARSRPDILIVHVESLRADMLRPDVAPSMVALAKEALSPPDHFTTGTNTGTGVFGILHGLLSPYYPLARREHVRPLPLRILRALGYRVSVYFANNFREYDGLYELFFGGLADFTYSGPTEPVYAADAQMVDSYVASIRDARGEAPRFDYLVLDSTHYDYSYPPEFEKFSPAMTLDLGFRDGIIRREGINEEFAQRGPYVKNRYQNSILYADSLVRRILDALRDTGRLDRTIVVVAGDHGEEFWEHGTFGHGYGRLSPEQCRVPLVLRLPGGRASTRYRYTTHADIFPTIFDAMGLDTAGGAFMNGKSLLRYDPALDLAVSGYGITGEMMDPRLVVAGDGLVVHWADGPPFPVTEVTAEDGAPLPDPPTARADDLVVRAIGAKELR